MLALTRYPIRWKLTAMSLEVSAVALALATVGFMSYDAVAYRNALVKNVSTLGEVISLNASASLVFNDSASALKTLEALKAKPSVVAAAIYTTAGKPFAVWQRDPNATVPAPRRPIKNENHVFTHDSLVLFHPILLDRQVVGTVGIVSDVRDVSAQFKRYAGIALGVLLISLVAAAWISLHVARRISRPIRHLVDVVESVVDHNDYTVRASGEGPDEIGRLIRTFNIMLAKTQDDGEALKHAHDELERRVEERTIQLKSANQELEAFSYSVSHDLRAPLRHISGFADLLGKNAAVAGNPTALRQLGIIIESVQQMGALIDDLLNFSRMGRTELLKTSLDLNALLHEVIEAAAPQYAGRAVEWEIGPLPHVRGDPAMIRVVFTNLISNALKYSRQRQPATIRITAERGPQGETVIAVKDNGAGFDMKYADKLFGVFQRLHSSDDFEGTGIGLATVRRILHRHGGEVRAAAAVNEGATFYVTFPAESKEAPYGAR